MNNTIRRRRLFVSGASQLSEKAAALWRTLGRLLADKDGPVVVTGGLAALVEDHGALTADKMIIDGMLSELRKQGLRVEERIETFLPDEMRDPHREFRFKEGRIRQFTKRNSQSRRFSMMHSADVVIAIEGEKGTRSVTRIHAVASKVRFRRIRASGCVGIGNR